MIRLGWMCLTRANEQHPCFVRQRKRTAKWFHPYLLISILSNILFRCCLSCYPVVQMWTKDSTSVASLPSRLGQLRYLYPEQHLEQRPSLNLSLCWCSMEEQTADRIFWICYYFQLPLQLHTFPYLLSDDWLQKCLFSSANKWHFECGIKTNRDTFYCQHPPKSPQENDTWTELSFPSVNKLSSYIFELRKTYSTRNCNVLFEYLYFVFWPPYWPLLFLAIFSSLSNTHMS